jgi:hypothetical protein
VPIATLLLWFAFGGRKRGEAVWRIALVAAAASMVTHPIAWWANRSLVGTLGMTERYTLIELAVVVVEAVIYRGAIATRTVAAGVTSLVANAASFGFGLWRMLAGG